MYRDLGLPVQAKQIAEKLYQTSTDEEDQARGGGDPGSHLVNEISYNEDDEEMWLKRADTTSPSVQQLLLRLEARRLSRKGKLAEADRAFARLIEGYERDASHESSSANNAAVSYLERYQTSGDPAHLRAAVKHLEASHRLTPQNAMVAGNLAGRLAHLGRVTALDRWIKTSKLPLGAGEASAGRSPPSPAGPLRDEVLGALRKDPSFRRSLDVSAEEQALAPQKAGGYERVESWLALNEDEKGLAELDKRLAAMPPFDASAIAEERRVRRARTKAAFDKALAEQGAARAEGRRPPRRADRTRPHHRRRLAPRRHPAGHPRGPRPHPRAPRRRRRRHRARPRRAGPRAAWTSRSPAPWPWSGCTAPGRSRPRSPAPSPPTAGSSAPAC